MTEDYRAACVGILYDIPELLNRLSCFSFQKILVVVIVSLDEKISSKVTK